MSLNKMRDAPEKETIEQLIAVVKESIEYMVRQKLMTQKEADELFSPKPMTKERKRKIQEYLKRCQIPQKYRRENKEKKGKKGK